MSQKKKEPTKEQKEALEKFKKQFPGVWELIKELFGEWSKDQV